ASGLRPVLTVSKCWRACLSNRMNNSLDRLTRGAVAALALLACAGPARAAEEKAVSFYRDVFPIFKRSCNGCHHPGKLKGELDLTTYAAFLKGGKHGTAFKAGDPKESI